MKVWTRPGALTMVLIFMGIIALAGAGRAVYKQWHWKRFAVVEENRIYRSGQLEPAQLRSAIRRLELRTVICLNPARVEQEKQICDECQVDFIHHTMPDDGLGTAEQFAEVLKILNDPARQPVLVHCQAGVARTGAAIALHRILREGWDRERAIAELSTFERKGRCSPQLQQHIARLHHELAPH